MKNSFLFLILICYSVISNAQDGPFGYYRDALLFSQTSPTFGSTARMQAIGGAQTALGGDLSSISSNPAGLGFFNRSVFSATMGLDFISTETRYFDETTDDSKANFNLPNVGAVFNFSKGPYSRDKFKGGSLGISISRMRSFHLNRAYSSPNDFNSIIDSFLDNSGQVVPDQLGGYELAAFDQYLINPTFDNNNTLNGYDSFVLGFPIQSETIEESGSQYQLNIAWGGNYDDRLYFGGGLGVQILNYRQERTYVENDFVVFDADGNGTPDEFLNAINIYDELRVRGNGINFNFGAIYRPVNFITFGVNYTTPTFMALDEEGFFDLSADWRAGTTITETDADGNDVVTDISNIDPFQSNLIVSDYSLRTPSRLSVGTSIFVGKGGFLSVDVERVNYTGANISSRDFSGSADNDEIDRLYQDVLNVRVGGEYRFGNLRLRGGYAIFPSPYSDSNLQERTNVSFGLGYRNADFFLDLAVINSQSQELYVPYEVSFDQPIATSDINTTSAVITFGLNF